ncbi:MAG: hypothetical protein J6W88_02535 [Bacteroidales bacterium]|nr:hypothetical protein [Bacteroidales bacterium]
MKNIFKFMAIALVSSSMLFACGDKDNENDNNNNGDNNGGNNTNTPTAKVTFGSTSWDASVNQIYTANYANYGVNEFIMYKTAQSYPYVDMMISSTPGTYQHEAYLGMNEEQGYTYYAWQTGQSADEMYLPLYFIDYYESQSIGQNQDGDWQPVSATLTVNSFDANTLTANFNLNATMYDAYSWNADLVTNAEDAETRTLTVDVKGMQFTEITSK